jgi:hypothetical protein
MEKNKKHEPITLGEIQNFLLQNGWERIQEDLFHSLGLNRDEIVENILECNPDNLWCDDKLTSEEMVKLIDGHFYHSEITHDDLVNECRTRRWTRSDYYFTKDDTTIFFVLESDYEEKELQSDWFWCETTSGDRLLQNEHLYFLSDLIQKIKDSEFNKIRQQKINEHKQIIKELETLK